MSIWFLIAVLGGAAMLLYVMAIVVLGGAGAMMGSEQGKSLPRNVGPGPHQTTSSP